MCLPLLAMGQIESDIAEPEAVGKREIEAPRRKGGRQSQNQAEEKF